MTTTPNSNGTLVTSFLFRSSTLLLFAPLFSPLRLTVDLRAWPLLAIHNVLHIADPYVVVILSMRINIVQTTMYYPRERKPKARRSISTLCPPPPPPPPPSTVTVTRGNVTAHRFSLFWEIYIYFFPSCVRGGEEEKSAIICCALSSMATDLFYSSSNGV